MAIIKFKSQNGEKLDVGVEHGEFGSIIMENGIIFNNGGAGNVSGRLVGTQDPAYMPANGERPELNTFVMNSTDIGYDIASGGVPSTSMTLAQMIDNAEMRIMLSYMKSYAGATLPSTPPVGSGVEDKYRSGLVVNIQIGLDHTKLPALVGVLPNSWYYSIEQQADESFKYYKTDAYNGTTEEVAGSTVVTPSDGVFYMVFNCRYFADFMFGENQYQRLAHSTNSGDWYDSPVYTHWVRTDK